MKLIACFLIVCPLTLTVYNSNAAINNTDAITTLKDTTVFSAGSTSGFKLGVQMWTFRVFTFAEALDKVDSAGIKNIEAFGDKN